MKLNKEIKLQFAKDVVPKNRDEVQFGVGKCGRGYPVKFLGVRRYDNNKKCPHCNRKLVSVMELEIDYIIEFRCTECNKEIQQNKLR